MSLNNLFTWLMKWAACDQPTRCNVHNECRRSLRLRTYRIQLKDPNCVGTVFWYLHRLMGNFPFHLKYVLTVTHRFEKRRLRPISAYNVWTVRANEKCSIIATGSRLRAFQWAIDEVRTLPLTHTKGGSKTEFVVFVLHSFFVWKLSAVKL